MRTSTMRKYKFIEEFPNMEKKIAERKEAEERAKTYKPAAITVSKAASTGKKGRCYLCDSPLDSISYVYVGEKICKACHNSVRASYMHSSWTYDW